MSLPQASATYRTAGRQDKAEGSKNLRRGSRPFGDPISKAATSVDTVASVPIDDGTGIAKAASPRG